MTAKWRGLHQIDDMIAKLKALPVALGEQVVDSTRDKTPKRTGKLSNSIEYSVENGIVTVGSKLDYSKPVEYGTEDTPPVGMLGATALEVPEMIDKLLGTDR